MITPPDGTPDREGGGFYDFLHQEPHPIATIQQAYLQRSPSNEMSRVLDRALGHLSPTCPECGGFCDVHSDSLRAAFMARAGDLCRRLEEGTGLYFQLRQFGIGETDALLQEVYGVWGELSALLLVAEPQSMFGLAEAEETEGEEDG